MGQEQQPSPLKHIHVDLENWSVILEGADGRAISFNPNLLLQRLLSPALRELPAGVSEEPEKEPTVKLSGRLKSQPKAGRPDGSGFPTAWARFAAHEEGSGQAHMYIATFHRKAMDIALGLKPESQIIVEGYPHKATQPDKSDTLSVVHIIHYPGKPANANHAS
jgi:hypothetical protein